MASSLEARMRAARSDTSNVATSIFTFVNIYPAVRALVFAILQPE